MILPIPHCILDCSIYLYGSVKSAQDGDSFGGSGFLIHVPSRHEGFIHPYAVTNKHVVDGGFRVLRMNTSNGKFDVIPSEPESWTLHPEGDDLAAMPIKAVDGKFQWFSIGVEKFITHDILDDNRIGLGDEVFLVGRLVTTPGRQRNTPVIRFGNLSMMADPKEPVTLESGHEQECFLVECRSLSGFSGSPVFIDTTGVRVYGDRIPKAPQLAPPNTVQTISDMYCQWLLGVDCSHIPLWKPVYEGKCKTDYRVEANTGIACVIPAWRILELLNDEDLVKARKTDDAEIARSR